MAHRWKFWRYQKYHQKPNIEEWETIQWAIERRRKDEQWSTKHGEIEAHEQRYKSVVKACNSSEWANLLMHGFLVDRCNENLSSNIGPFNKNILLYTVYVTNRDSYLWHTKFSQWNTIRIDKSIWLTKMLLATKSMWNHHRQLLYVYYMSELQYILDINCISVLTTFILN